MRRVLIASVPMALLATAACVTEAAQSRSDLPDPVAPSPAAAEIIAIREQSNVCVSVQVDQRVWPIPLTATTNSNLSGLLASQLRRRYEEQGGSGSLPAADYLPRFVDNHDGAHPACQDRGEDIYVTVNYVPRADGTPFTFNYRVEQGSVTRSGSRSRDIREELRTGRLRYLNIDEPMQLALADDLRDSAAAILAEIH